MRYIPPTDVLEQCGNMAIEPRVERAIEAGLAFLAATQLASGEFPVFTCKRRDMAGEMTADPSVFPTALAAHALGFVPRAEMLVERAIRFLLDQRDARGVWRHWTRDHPYMLLGELEFCKVTGYAPDPHEPPILDDRGLSPKEVLGVACLVGHSKLNRPTLKSTANRSSRRLYRFLKQIPGGNQVSQTLPQQLFGSGEAQAARMR
jgi:hypothetical protein